MARTIRRYHIGYQAVEADDIVEKAIQLVLEVPLLGGAEQTIDAGTTGAKAFAHTAQKLRSEHLKHLKSAQLLLDFKWATTADGTIRLYDEDAAAVLAETSTFTGGEEDDDLLIDLTGTLKAGNRIVVQANVTAAATGETASLFRAVLKLVVGVS